MSGFDSMECTHDGVVMDAFVAVPKGEGPHPAVAMFPGATGTGPTFEKRVREMADNGYLAVAWNVYGKGADLSSPEAAGALFMDLLAKPDVLRARVTACFDAMAARPDVDATRIAATGYCFGGKCVLELARGGADARAVVAYHGLLETHAPAQVGEVTAQVVAWCAGQDPYAPVEHLDGFMKEMADAGVSHQVTLFSDAQHSFTDPDHEGIQPGIAYDPVCDAVSWAGTLALFGEVLAKR